MGLNQTLSRRAQLWHQAAHWMYLRWWVRQDRAHWPAVARMSLEEADTPHT